MNSVDESPENVSPPAAWQPLLEGRDAERAWETVEAIAAELSRRGPELLDEMHPGRRPTLAGGTSGLALFFAYLAEVGGDEAHADTALDLLDRSAEDLAAAATLPDLHSGFTGVAWALEHLEGRLFESSGEDGNAAIDEALGTFLAQPSAAAEYDLIRGLAGFGIYGLERLPRPSGSALVSQVLARLDESASRDGDGLAWFTPAERLPEHQRHHYPDGHFNLGMAHGLPGVVPVLAGAAAAGVDGDRARRLLEGAVAWMLAHRLREGAASCFPYAVKPHTPPHSGDPCRLAWCYGDPGVAAGLLAAARAVGEPVWEHEAVATAIASAHRPAEEAGIQDAGLCHGSAGLGHLYNRLYQATGEEVLAQAARFWLHRSLEFRLEHGREGRGVAGFPTWSPQEGSSQEFEWKDDPGLLTGAAGIGLALLAAVSGVEPEWDRVLGVSLR